MDKNMTYGEKLKQFRLDKSLSQEALGKILGTSKQVLSRYETNTRTPKITVAQDFAEKLGVPVTYFLDTETSYVAETATPYKAHTADFDVLMKEAAELSAADIKALIKQVRKLKKKK